MHNVTLSEIAYREIKKLILTGEYSPKERLLIEKVSERLGISMTPVKDAFRILEQEGLVQNIPRKGTFVTQLSDVDVYEYCQIRLSLESLAVDIICDSKKEISPAVEKELQTLNKKIERALKNKDKSEFITYDGKFHLEIVKLSGNARLGEMLNYFPLSNFLVVMGGGVMELSECEEVVAQHNHIISLLKNHDGEKVKAIIKENIFTFHSQLFKS